MDLFRISRELKFEVCSCRAMCKFPQQAKENDFIGGKEDWEDYSKQRIQGFSLAESLPGKEEESFFFLLGSVVTTV